MLKEHFKEHKTKYILVVIGTFAGITVIIVRGRHAGVQSVPDGLAKVTVRPFSFNFFSKASGNMVTSIQREGRGNPGYITRCLETGELFNTQGSAARAFNLSPAMLSAHLNGKIDNVNGNHFERLGIID